MRYVCLAWRNDDEGGFDICRKEDASYTMSRLYHPETGSHAERPYIVGEFDDAKRLSEYTDMSEDYAQGWIDRYEMDLVNHPPLNRERGLKCGLESPD